MAEAEGSSMEMTRPDGALINMCMIEPDPDRLTAYFSRALAVAREGGSDIPERPAIDVLARGVSQGRLAEAVMAVKSSITGAVQGYCYITLRNTLDRWLADVSLTAEATAEEGFQRSLGKVTAVLTGIEGTDISNREEGPQIFAPLYRELRRHNRQFAPEREYHSRTPVQTFQFTFDGKPFSFILERVGTTRALSFSIHTEEGEIKHEDIAPILREKA